MLTVIILTKNEANHIERAIESVGQIADNIVVVDSGSTDATKNLAAAKGALVLENQWVNYATQLNWTIDQLPENTQWVLRLDADEYITPELAADIRTRLSSCETEIVGLYVSRRMKFLGRQIRWGGVFPVKVIRLFRFGQGRCEDRWMDEHIIVNGRTDNLRGELIDDNLNTLTWWTHKHNDYASREVVDLLNLKYGFMRHETVADFRFRGANQAGIKRWIKENIYAHMPAGLRATIYFAYRYILRLGFLDGKEGAAFHFLQGFWYRFLVDSKMLEVELFINRNGVTPAEAIAAVLNIDVEIDRC